MHWAVLSLWFYGDYFGNWMNKGLIESHHALGKCLKLGVIEKKDI